MNNDKVDNELTRAQEIILSVTPIPFGIISFAASATIVWMIYKSPIKFGNPFRRIFFGICLYDLFQSIGAMFSTFAAPVDTNGDVWGAVGSQGTCVAQGILLQVGTLGSAFYSTILAIFYLCVIKFSMSHDKFAKFEKWLHVVTNIAVWSSAIYLASAGLFNFKQPNCWINEYPEDCINDPDVECVRGQNIFRYQWAFAGIPILGCFVLNIVIMFIMILSMIMLQRKMSRLRNNWRTSTTQQPMEETSSFSVSIIKRFSRRFSRMSSLSLRSKNRDEDVSAGGGFRDTMMRPRPSIYEPTSSRSITNRRTAIRQSEMERNLQFQAVLYALAFIITFLFTYVNRILVSKHGSSPFIILFLPRIFRPLQGLFNIIIYTRIRVSRLRKNTRYSWMKAFYTVVRSFDDHDDMTQHEESRSGGEGSGRRRRSIFQLLFDGSNDNNNDVDKSNEPSFPILDPSKVETNNEKDEMKKEVEFEKKIEEGTILNNNQLHPFPEKESNLCLSEKDSMNSYLNNIDEKGNVEEDKESIRIQKVNDHHVQEEASLKDGDAVSVSDHQDGDSGSVKEEIDECDQLRGLEGKDDSNEESFLIP